MALAPQKQASSVFGAVTQTLILDTEASAVADDLVRLHPTTDGLAIVATDNFEIRPVIGVISEKITATTAEVILRGVINTSLTDIGRVYLSPTGTFSLTNPGSNFLQNLGYSFGNGKLHFEPVSIVTKLS